MSISLFILLLVFLGIAFRQLLRIRIKIWQMMTFGALIVLITGQINLHAIPSAIDWNLLGFLFGMFVIGAGVEESGLLDHWAARHLSNQCSNRKLSIFIVFGMGLASTLLMNDTVAILGTPLLVQVAKKRNVPFTPLLIALAFSITTASVFSPIGNPQNLLIALSLPNKTPFLLFIKKLLLPTILSLLPIYFLTLSSLRNSTTQALNLRETHPVDLPLARLSKMALWLVLVLIIYRLFSEGLSLFPIPLFTIAIFPASLLLLFSSKRKVLFTKLDWATLTFFASLFILMQSVWETSSLKELINQLPLSTLGIFTAGILGSQLLSNVPLVMLYLPTLHDLGYSAYLDLAVSSTLAGNFLIFGAASNYIILQSAEKREGRGFCMYQFAKRGIPLTLFQLSIYWLCTSW